MIELAIASVAKAMKATIRVAQPKDVCVSAAWKTME